MNPWKIYFCVLAAIALAVVSALSPGRCHAETAIGAHIGSHHFEKNGEMNNVNPGLYGNYDGWTGGFYYNSERRWSVYGGYTFETYLMERLAGAITVGLITGYAGHTVLPMVVPSARFVLTPQVSARLAFAPRATKHGAAVLHLSMEYRY